MAGLADIEISVVLNLVGEFATIRKILRHLQAQTALDRMELIVVTGSGGQKCLDMEVIAGFRFSKIVVLESIPTGAVGWAAGVRAASGRIVVLAEDHSYPEANWAERLLVAHRGDWAVVGPRIENGNPGTLTSCANFLMCFVEWFGVSVSKEARRGAGHNSSYKRELVLELGAALVEGLLSEGLLHDQLVQRGHRIYLEAGTSTQHVNISKLGAFCRQSYLGGRIFGGLRAESFPFWKRWLYGGGFWLVPPIRLKRIFDSLGSAANRKEARFYAAIPMLLVGLFCHAFGEAIGSLWGTGDVFAEYTYFELKRIESVVPGERRLLLDVDDVAAQGR